MSRAVAISVMCMLWYDLYDVRPNPKTPRGVVGLEENVVAPVIAAGGAVRDRIGAPVDADFGAEGEGTRAGHGDALNWRAAIGG